MIFADLADSDNADFGLTIACRCSLFLLVLILRMRSEDSASPSATKSVGDLAVRGLVHDHVELTRGKGSELQKRKAELAFKYKHPR